MKKLCFIPFVVLATPALAHQGDHTGFDWMGLAAHLFEPDHIVFAAIAGLTGILAFKAGRRAEARVHATKERNHDSR